MQQHLDQLRLFSLATLPHVVQMLNAQNKEEQHHVDVFWIILVIPMWSVDQSALSTLNAQGTRPVSTTTAQTHVLVCVVFMPAVGWQTMYPNARVILDILGMHSLHVLE